MSASGAVVNLCAYVLQTSLLLAVGLVLPVLFRLRDPRVRYRYWMTLLAVSLLLPLLVLPIMGRPAQGAASATAYVAGAMTMTVQPGAQPFSPWPWVLGFLTAVAAARFLWILVGLFRLEGMRRSSPVLHPLPPSVQSEVAELRIGTEFRISEEARSPLTFGWRRPVVLLPAGFDTLNSEAQRCIALHELLHVKRGDWPVILVEEFIRSLLWFHPAVWLVLDRIALSREQVVDREVVRLTHERAAYMNTLAAMARHRQSAGAVAYLPFFHRSHLLQRLALLTKEVSMSKLRLGLAVSGSVAVLVFAGVVATRAFPLVGQPGDAPTAESALESSTSPSQSAEPAVYQIGTKGLTEPRLIKRGEFVRPPGAPPKNVETLVVLGLVINERGVPTEIKVLKSDNDLLSAETIKGVSQWRWDPAKLDGKPVSIRWIITVLWGDKAAAHQGSEALKQLSPPVAPIPDEHGVYPMGSIPPPKMLKQVTPDYPPEAKEKGIGGKVVLQVVINERGEPTQAKVLKSDNEIFNAAALAAVSQWRFEPPMFDGLPVKVDWIISIKFMPAP